MTRLHVQHSFPDRWSELAVHWDQGGVPEDSAALCEACVMMFVSLLEALEPRLADGSLDPVSRAPRAGVLVWSPLPLPVQSQWLGVLKGMLRHLPTPPDRALLGRAGETNWREWAPPASEAPLDAFGIADWREADALSVEIELPSVLHPGAQEALDDVIDIWLSVGALGGFAADSDPVPSQLIPNGGLQVNGDLCWLALASAQVDDLAFEALARMVHRLGGPFTQATLRIE